MAQLSTLIAEGVEITGDLLFTNGMRIDGRVKGDVTGRPAADANSPSLLVLSANGHIEGSVRCGDAVINGTVIGDLDVEHRLELQSDARVTGTIRYRQLQMDVGATVQGHLLRVAPQAVGRQRRRARRREGGGRRASLTPCALRRCGQSAHLRVGAATPPHSITMPASLTSLAHLACSSAMKRPNSAALMSPGSAPLATRSLRTSGIASTLATSSCSLATTAGGVAFGASRPNQPCAW